MRAVTPAHLLLAYILVPDAPAQVAPEPLEFLDNGVIRVGLDTQHGGTLAYLSLSDVDDSVINVHDMGRYVQQSYYSGPCPYIPDGATQHPGWAGWCWNPIQAGDAFGNGAAMTELRNDGTTLYSSCVPKQWALDDVDGECTLKTWVTLDENRVHLRYRLENARSDPTRYPAAHQELPAIYTIGRLHRLFTYTGDAPFTDGTPTQIVNSGPPWEYWTSTECWAALVDDDGWGLGVFHPGAYHTVGGLSGPPGTGGPKHGPTGYIAPLHTDVIDHDITYEYEVTLILGDLRAEIRPYVYAHAPSPPPDLVFASGRAHCVPANLTDDSPPFDGAWRLVLDQGDPQIVGPLSFWHASDVPTLWVRAAYRTQAAEAEVFFASPGEGFTAAKRVVFAVIPDGVERAYAVDLASNPHYAGPIGRLRFDPIVQQSPGDEVDLLSIRRHP